jgi:hypothetical protein
VNTICFSEPSWLKTIRTVDQSPTQFKNALLEKFNKIRLDVSQGLDVELTVKRNSNSLPDNYFRSNTGVHLNLKETKKVNFGALQNPMICVKANTLFTALLPTLTKENDFEITALVRDPVATIMSWRSLSIPVSYGKITIGKLYSAKIRSISKLDDLLEKQVKIIDWFFETYYSSNIRVSKYEDLIVTPNHIINNILGYTVNINQDLKSQNNSKNYCLKEKDKIIEYLNKYSTYAKIYYDY